MPAFSPPPRGSPQGLFRPAIPAEVRRRARQSVEFTLPLAPALRFENQSRGRVLLVGPDEAGARVLVFRKSPRTVRKIRTDRKPSRWFQKSGRLRKCYVSMARKADIFWWIALYCLNPKKVCLFWIRCDVFDSACRLFVCCPSVFRRNGTAAVRADAWALGEALCG